MGIRNDGVDTQNVDIENGTNPYTESDFDIYTPAQIDMLANHDDDIFEIIDGIRNALSDLGRCVDSLTPTLKNVCDVVEKLEQATEYEELK